MDPTEIRCEGMDWINLAHDSNKCHVLINMVMDFWVP
jgi:hypothetical protein